MKTYQFTFIFVGKGDTEEEALEDAANASGLYDLVDDQGYSVEVIEGDETMTLDSVNYGKEG